MGVIDLNGGKIGTVRPCDADTCKNVKSTTGIASKSLLHSIAIRVKDSDGYSLCGEAEGNGAFDLAFRKGSEFSFVKVSQVDEFNEGKLNFIVSLETWLHFVECAAATVRSCGVYENATVCLEEIKTIVSDDRKVAIQHVIGRHPLEQAAADILRNELQFEPEWDSEDEDAGFKFLWNRLGDIAIDDNECIDSDFYIWPEGTPREEIWRWFDSRYSKGVAHLMGIAD